MDFLCNPNSFIFRDNIVWHKVVPLNNFVASMRNFPWVQGRTYKYHQVVCDAEENSYSIILPLFFLVSLMYMNMQMRYFLYMTI